MPERGFDENPRGVTRDGIDRERNPRSRRPYLALEDEREGDVALRSVRDRALSLRRLEARLDRR